MKTFGKLLTVAIILCAVSSCKKEPVRVACMGDSITYGHGIADRDNDTYPAQLGKILGDRYDVRNFGVCGVTLMNGTDMPYSNEQAYRDALEFNPQIITLLLGTNDSKPYNWKDQEQFKTDAKAMIDELRSLPSNPEIWLMLPTPAMGHAWNIDDSIISAFVIPGLKEVAQQEGLPVIDLYTPFIGKGQYFPDTIHPTEQGDSVITDIIFNTIFK